MLGQGVRPTRYDPLTESIGPLDLDRMLRGMRTTIARAAEEMPPHARFISQYRAAPPA